MYLKKYNYDGEKKPNHFLIFNILKLVKKYE